MAEKPREIQGAPEPADGLLESLRRILRPLVRLLIARSLTFQWAANVLRGVYVDVALREFPVGGKRQTDSRITLLTGVHRKDVKRLRSPSRAGGAAPRAASLGTQLIARWTALPEYLDAQGAPRPLARLATAGDEHSFESLVRSINTDIRPRVVLDEWLRLGLVRVDERDRVCLDVQAFIPSEGSDEMAYFFGRNLHDHVAAAVHNMLGEPEPFLDRSVNYNNLSRASLTELTELGRRPRHGAVAGSELASAAVAATRRRRARGIIALQSRHLPVQRGSGAGRRAR